MVFLGYAVALIAFYSWIKGNWFVPLVVLIISAVCISGWGNLTWFSFFELAGICYAPIVARFLIRGFIEHVREEMAGRTFGRYVIDSFISLGDLPPKKQPTARRQPPPVTGLVIEHRALD